MPMLAHPHVSMQPDHSLQTAIAYRVQQQLAPLGVQTYRWRLRIQVPHLSLRYQCYQLAGRLRTGDFQPALQQV